MNSYHLPGTTNFPLVKSSSESEISPILAMSQNNEIAALNFENSSSGTSIAFCGLLPSCLTFLYFWEQMYSAGGSVPRNEFKLIFISNHFAIMTS